MSGICGILRLDGGPAEGIGGMLTLLERRGPDGTNLWQDGSVSLGHALLATTPEALHETMPLTHLESGCTITADVRLDNREDLISALRLVPSGHVVGDGELILRAYLAWGEECPKRLLGDFAFAIWDPRTQRLFAATDQMGMRRFAYAYVPGRTLVFATEPRAVRVAPDVPKELDYGKIADFLEVIRDEIDDTSTLYTAVQRLRPAHVLVAQSQRLLVRRYWALEPGPPPELGSDEAYAEVFLEVFSEAVRCRLRNAGGLGAMLSGGMDSASVVAVATRLLESAGRGPLPTISVVGPNPENQAEAVAIRRNLETLPGLEPHLIDIGMPSVWLDDIHEVLHHIEEPFDSLMTIQLLAYLQAKRAGLRVVFDGLAGDVVLGSGRQMAQLIRCGRWLELWRETGEIQRFWNDNEARWYGLGGALRDLLVPDGLRRLRRRWASRHWMEPSSPLLTRSFARHVDRASRMALHYRNNRAPLRLPPWDRVSTITSLSLLSARVHSDQVASCHGLEPRDPFMDLRLIGFCLRCPSEQMSWNGWPKLILRRAMKGLLAEEVIWRTGRTHFGYSMREVLWASAGLVPDHGPELSKEVTQLLRHATGRTYGQMLEEPLSPSLKWNYTVLALWLQEHLVVG